MQERVAAAGSRLCVGLDPRPGAGGVAEAEEFLARVIGETAEHAAAFKPNAAYFEALGAAGVALLERTVARIPADSIVLSTGWMP